MQDFFHQHYFGVIVPICHPVHLFILQGLSCYWLWVFTQFQVVAELLLCISFWCVPLWIVLHQELSYKTGPYGVISPVKMALQIGFTGIISPRNKWSYWILTYNWWLWAHLVPEFLFDQQFPSRVLLAATHILRDGGTAASRWMYPSSTSGKLA